MSTETPDKKSQGKWIPISEALHMELKVLATRQSRSLTGLIGEMLENELPNQEQKVAQ